MWAITVPHFMVVLVTSTRGLPVAQKLLEVMVVQHAPGEALQVGGHGGIQVRSGGLNLSLNNTH